MPAARAVLCGVLAITGSFTLAVGWLIHRWPRLLPTFLSLAIACLVILTTRHIQLLRRRRSQEWPRLPRPANDTPIPRPPRDYYLFVLGSGGHTKEMLMMMDDGFCDFAGFHRRYLVSSGDVMSLHHLRDYEDQLRELCCARGTSPGTCDVRVVTRARRVHQRLWTTPFTALRSVVDVLAVLLSPPALPESEQHSARGLRYPRYIMSNGPGTGFVVALAAHALKVLGVVPDHCMRFVYIESWARISSLSLTGKLLLRTGVADAMYVQHQQVADAYGLVNAGEMVFNARRPDVSPT